MQLRRLQKWADTNQNLTNHHAPEINSYEGYTDATLVGVGMNPGRPKLGNVEVGCADDSGAMAGGSDIPTL